MRNIQHTRRVSYGYVLVGFKFVNVYKYIPVVGLRRTLSLRHSRTPSLRSKTVVCRPDLKRTAGPPPVPSRQILTRAFFCGAAGDMFGSTTYSLFDPPPARAGPGCAPPARSGVLANRATLAAPRASSPPAASIPPAAAEEAAPVRLCGVYTSRVNYPGSTDASDIEGHVLAQSYDGQNWQGKIHWRFADGDAAATPSHTSYMTGVTTADQNIRFSQVSQMVDNQYGQGTTGFALVEIQPQGQRPLLLFNGISGDSFRARLTRCPQ